MSNVVELFSMPKIIPEDDYGDPGAELTKFLEDRTKEKTQFYSNVIAVGTLMLVGGTFFSLMQGTFNIPSKSYSNMILLLITNLFRVIGTCIVSTVPTNEFDLCKTLAKHKIWRRATCGFTIVAVLAFPTWLIQSQYQRNHSILSCACAYLIIPISLITIFVEGTYESSEKNEDLRYRNCTWVFISIPTLILLAFSITIITTPNYQYASDLHQILMFAGCLFGLLLIILLQASVLCCNKLFHLRHDDQHHKHDTKLCCNFVITSSITSHPGWGWKLVYSSVSLCAVIIGFGFLLNASLYTIPSYGGEHRKLIMIQNYLLFAIDVIPFILVFIFGSNRCFMFIVRMFEYHPQRLHEDGLMLAKMIKNWDITNEGNNLYWLNRSTESEAHVQIGRDIHREVFILGSYSKPENTRDPNYFEVTFSYHVDDDKSWYGWYKYENMEFVTDGRPDTKLNFDGLKEHINSSSLISQEIFTSWVNENFDTKEKKKYIFDEESLKTLKYIKVKVPNPNTKKKSEELRSHARDYMRCYKFDIEDANKLEEFKKLLEVSPRKLKTDEDKRKAYALSEHVDFSSLQEVDYFVSHSWDDDHQVKYDKVVKHFEKKKKKERNVTMWLDKVCIDQMHPEMGLAVLPLNINACKKFLLLLSRIYLTRLWCVWELFTLFLFCNKELALERIEIVFLEDDHLQIKEAIKNFKLDSVHCFGPNEEKVIRSLVKYIQDHDKNHDIFESIKDKLLQHPTIKGIDDTISKSAQTMETMEHSDVRPLCSKEEHTDLPV